MKSIALIFMLLTAACATLPRDSVEPLSTFCKPTQTCWPTDAQWKELATQLSGKLEKVQEPDRDDTQNPFALEEQEGATQGTGWLSAWSPTLSIYGVAVENANDVAIAINFARQHRLRLVVKGTGHDYLGRSSAPDSLLIWTHPMRAVTTNDSFVPQGCSVKSSKRAVTVEAGARWLEVYNQVTGKHQRYVQGGGCTSVGAAGGFLQGGGFGSWSKKYGIAAASLLEAEVVTADGKVRVANSCQNTDLFWALRGGGGGTFGVVTKVTLMTHPLPNYFGSVSGKIRVENESTFRDLLEEFLRFYNKQLNDEHWGEQIRVNGDNSIDVNLVFQGLRTQEAQKIWQPLQAWIEHHKDDVKADLHFVEIPSDKMWNYDYIREHFPDAIRSGAKTGKAGTVFWWWTGDGEQVNGYLAAYKSRWIPESLLAAEQAQTLARALFEASRYWSVGIHFNKGQAGAAKDAIDRGRSTSINPRVFEASALLIIAAMTKPAEAEVARNKIAAAISKVEHVLPYQASYSNEADFFEKDWQKSFWGENYSQLISIKRKYDPDNLFVCHHCVGSEP